MFFFATQNRTFERFQAVLEVILIQRNVIVNDEVFGICSRNLEGNVHQWGKLDEICRLK